MPWKFKGTKAGHSVFIHPLIQFLCRHSLLSGTGLLTEDPNDNTKEKMPILGGSRSTPDSRSSHVHLIMYNYISGKYYQRKGHSELRIVAMDLN